MKWNCRWHYKMESSSWSAGPTCNPRYSSMAIISTSSLFSIAKVRSKKDSMNSRAKWKLFVHLRCRVYFKLNFMGASFIFMPTFPMDSTTTRAHSWLHCLCPCWSSTTGSPCTRFRKWWPKCRKPDLSTRCSWKNNFTTIKIDSSPWWWVQPCTRSLWTKELSCCFAVWISPIVISSIVKPISSSNWRIGIELRSFCIIITA